MGGGRWEPALRGCNRAGNEMLAAAIVQELIRVLDQQRDESGGGGE
jgi:hypothetical protein